MTLRIRQHIVFLAALLIVPILLTAGQRPTPTPQTAVLSDSIPADPQITVGRLLKPLEGPRKAG